MDVKTILSVLLLAPALALAAPQSPVEVVAKTLWHEARGEGSDGLHAVASVIWNRSADGQSLRDVCLARRQFSCWNGKQNLSAGSGKVWQECLRLARLMVADQFTPSHSYSHYYAHKVVTPRWASGVKSKVVIGNHTFLAAR